MRFLTAVRCLIRYPYTTRLLEVHIDVGVKSNDLNIACVKHTNDLTVVLVQSSAHFDASLGCAGTSIDGFARQGCHLFVQVGHNASPALVGSCCGLQSTISLSTTDSELTSGTACAKEVDGQMTFLKEVFCDIVTPWSSSAQPCT